MAAVGLSATITVLLGLHIATEWQDRFANFALVLGALLTVLSAGDAFYQHRSLWIIRATAANRLKRLEQRIAYYKAGLEDEAPDESVVNSFFESFDRALDDEEQAWLNLRGKSPVAEVGSDSRPTAVPPVHGVSNPSPN